MKTDKVKNKLLLYRTLLFLGTSTISMTSTLGITIKNNLETVLKVSNDVREQLYNQSILDYLKYFDTYAVKTNENRLKIHTLEEKSNDKFITVELLEKLNTLGLDMDYNEDLTILEKCPNLKTLAIEGTERLTDKDIEEINKSSLTNLILSFNYNNVAKTRENKLDLAKFKNKNIKIKLRYTIGYSELNFLILFNYLKNYDDSMFENQDTLANYKELNSKLDKILEDIALKDDSTDIEKVLLISNYICNKITYDEDVSNYLNTQDEKEKESLKVKFAHKTLLYNHSEISSIFMYDEQEDTNGICINYAALFDILCYKAGVKSRLITAQSRKGIGHAWNIVYLNNEEKYIDLTFFDDVQNEFFLSCYSKDKVGFYQPEYYYDYLVNTMFENTEDTHTNYILNEKLENLNVLPERDEIQYFNEELEGTRVLNEEMNLAKPLIIGVGTGIIALSFSEIFRKKEKVKRKKV